MQITAPKHRFPMLNVKYAAIALGIVGALVAGTIIYTLTEDDSKSTGVVGAAPALTSNFQYVEPIEEGVYGANAAAAASTERNVQLPVMREGFNATGNGDDVIGASPKARGGSSATTNDDVTAYYNPVSGEGLIGGNEGVDPYAMTRDDLLAFHNPTSGEGIIGGNESADRSILAPQFRSYADILFAEQNWSVQETQRHSPRANGQLIQ